PFQRSVEAQITHEKGEKEALIGWEFPGVGALSLQTVNLELRAAGPSSVAVDGFRASLKSADNAAETVLEVLLPSARVVYSAENRLYLRVRNPHLAVMPEEISGIRSRLLGMG